MSGCARCAPWRERRIVFSALSHPVDDVTRDVLAHEGVCPVCGSNDAVVKHYEVMEPPR